MTPAQIGPPQRKAPKPVEGVFSFFFIAIKMFLTNEVCAAPKPPSKDIWSVDEVPENSFSADDDPRPRPEYVALIRDSRLSLSLSA